MPGVFEEDTSKEKTTLDFTASHTADYRLTFAVDARVKEYVKKIDEYKYELNYKVGDHNGEDEIYSVFFDWSDIVTIPGIVLSHGITEIEGHGYFWFRARKNNVQQGAHIIIDPTFGYAGDDDGYDAVNEYMRGGYYQITEDGIADFISVYMQTFLDPYACKCGLYDADGNFVGETEEIAVPAATFDWVTFEFSEPKPELSADEFYYIVIFSGDNFNRVRISYDAYTASENKYYSAADYSAGFPETATFTSETYQDRRSNIYCSYTKAEPPPSGPTSIEGDLLLKLGCGPGGAGARIPHADMGIGLQRHPRSRVH